MMDQLAAMAKLHAEMPRQGPGSADDVRWTVERLGLSGACRVVDAGCGPGADLETLAELLPLADLTGIELFPHLAEEARVLLGDRARIVAGDMARLDGPHDLIWSAGAIYFLGVTEGLQGWRDALAPGGTIAFSEPVLPEGPCDVAKAFWADYPAISDMRGLEARIDAAGFEVIDTRPVTGNAWLDYYASLAERIDQLRPGAEDGLREVVEGAAREMATWARAPEQILYMLCLVRPA